MLVIAYVATDVMGEMGIDDVISRLMEQSDGFTGCSAILTSVDNTCQRLHPTTLFNRCPRRLCPFQVVRDALHAPYAFR